MPKLKLLILDAGVVIKLHELELWSSIVDAGEAESLAFLVHQNDDYRISSGDAIVYKVLGNLNLGDQGISLEEILGTCGLIIGGWANDSRSRELTDRGQRHTTSGMPKALELAEGFVPRSDTNGGMNVAA